MLGRLHSQGGSGAATTSLRVMQRRCLSRHAQPFSRADAQALYFTSRRSSASAPASARGPFFAVSVLNTSIRCFRTSAALCASSLTSSPSTRSRGSSPRSSKHRNASPDRSSRKLPLHVRTQGRKPLSSSTPRQPKGDARVAEEVPSLCRGEDIDDDLLKAARASASGSHEDSVDSNTFTSGRGDRTTHGSAPPDTEQEAVQPRGEPGWGLETVNAITGKTALEELYDRNLSRIHGILERPLPPMPHDGSVDPDFFVGFASYSYQLRDQYRAVIARELHVPVKAVRLSVAWSGRFNVKRFGRVQKVCGVCLDRTALSGANDGAVKEKATNTTNTPDFTEQEKDANKASASDGLPDAIQQRIAQFVSAINTHKREDLLQVQLFQASPPIPEVEFALTRQEHRLVYHLHEWVRRHVLQRAVAVVVYGVPPSPLSTQALPKESTKLAEAATLEKEIRHRYEMWQQKASEESAAQQREVQSRWLRLFHRRELVPAVLSLTELATRVAIAVVRGDVSGVRLERKDADRADGQQDKENMEEAEAVLLNGPVRDLLIGMASVAVAPAATSSTASSVKETDCNMGMLAGAATAADDPREEAQPRCGMKDVLLPRNASGQSPETAGSSLDLTATATQQEAVLRWVRLVFQALLLREATSTSATTPTVALEVSLPALFAQGVYAGGRDEVAYLQHNRAALDALLLHPHEISFKKKFVSRLRNGYRRPQMEKEAAVSHSNSG
ncbi:putative mitochondrial hypothetical protein [Leptomonas pyrrhocoris]|uniref:Uncharacterized protein n=1 Tax=Leptomonas pyrrhocoris TaxID=157538 RepID=A0A0N0VF01_LEPPY|nr:putative mitochondrial hypothetical protein [Leptomonas pyrrhocoris]XP_015657663.1 putative mitochondrial hypothetical protein [Leptomonas pyrrhocoris]KPA79223.1 putative mitochondrial hypothetical protein [Leptomonas pyrrhocoris]KPA79224.1 putative mitochondrial hypothetical protein [Leptomonas pyrrhocoris]|eukprot:XP_015657662.1 putative mitochondrial hypothetical protein [Leptomonas pyrrhocoris]